MIRKIYPKFLKILIYVLPPLLFCSYYPLLSLGSDASMNFEFSLPEIWLLVFFLVTLLYLGSALRFYWHGPHRTQLFLLIAGAFWLYAGLSLLWTANFLRGLLTWGLLGLTIYAAFMLYYLLFTKFSTDERRLLLRIFLGSAVIFALWGVGQCLLDVYGVTSEVTLLCDGCTYTAFGFPRVSGLAIEPQFMGNLLLAPTLLALYGAVHACSPHRIWLMVVSVFLVVVLGLTLSRGAIYAFAVGVAILLIGGFAWQFDRKWLVASRLRQKWSRKHCKTQKSLHNKPNTRPNRGVENVENFSQLWLLAVLPAVGMIIALVVQGGLAAISPTTDTFWSGVTKSVHQLSLGAIDWRADDNQDNSDSIATDSTVDNEAVDSTFSGYVPESTNVRLQLSDLALDVWDDSASHFLSGVGLGGAGIALSEKDSQLSSKEIVQNQYLSVLLELGLVGFLLLLLFLVYLLKIVSRQKYSVYFLSLTVAYLLSLLFFAGLPNALHIYLFPALLLGTLPFWQKQDKIKAHA